MPYKIEILQDLPSFLGLEEKLEELYVATTDPNVYFSPEWVYTWWKHFGKKSQPIVLCVWADDKLAACWPFHKVPGIFAPGLWPMVYHISDYSDPLIRDTNDKELLEAVQNGIMKLLKKFHFVWAPLQRNHFFRQCTSPLLDKISNKRTVREPRLRLGITIQSPNFEEFLQAKLSTKALKNLRYGRRLLQREGEVDFKTLTSEEEVEDFMPDTCTIELNSWKSKEACSIYSVIGLRAFYFDLFPLLAKKQRASITVLKIDGQNVAYEMGLLAPGYYALHNTAYDEAYAKASPGRHLLLHNIQKSFEEKRERYDFMQGDQAYKAELANTCDPLIETFIFKKSLRGFLNRSLMLSYNRFRSRLREVSNEQPDTMNE